MRALAVVVVGVSLWQFSLGAVVTAAMLPAAAPQVPPPQQHGALLWELGTADGGNAEFALAVQRYREFQSDGCFCIGASDPAKDWPYVQPGPADTWAGGRQHTFTIAFGLRGELPGDGVCVLGLDFVDTHAQQPPRLRLRLNDSDATLRLPAGGGDASIQGEPAQGRHLRREVSFPAHALRAGTNLLQITTTSGSWLLWDHLDFAVPKATALAPVEATLLGEVHASAVLQGAAAALQRTVHASILHFGSGGKAHFAVGDAGLDVALHPGAQEVSVQVPEVATAATLPVVLSSGGKTLASTQLSLQPSRQLTIYLLPHSHTDIGYTELQTRIEEKQVDNLLAGIAAARRTADYPEDARFVWNVEVLWAADLYLQRLPPAQRDELFAAVQQGQVSLQGMYLNELSGLCRAEELLRLFRLAPALAAATGVPIDAAMISDVPGHTWGMVTSMAQAGIRYLSTAPNYLDRIGDVLVRWENKPFWWLSPSGQERVLVWIPKQGYALSHALGALSAGFVDDYLGELDRTGYPYDITCLRWSGHGDNAVPDASICDFVRQWNAQHVWPHFVIASTSTAFRALEARYGKDLPEVRGEWSPYWEDGAGSSAAETAQNRASADRLTQAEALWAGLDPAGYPVREFEAAWQQVLLYSEHTWGAWCSVSAPAATMTLEQWQQKQAFAVQADAESRRLLLRALQAHRTATAASAPAAFDVYNTTSWPRTEVVLVPAGISDAGDAVTDAAGHAVASQRLQGGELAVLVEDLAAFSSRRLRLAPGPAHAPTAAAATAHGAVLDNGLLRARVDEGTGGIVELRAEGIDQNLVDTASGFAVNDYLYLVGDDKAQLQRNGAVTLRVVDDGPLVATLRIGSPAPGCYSLQRELRLAAGQRHLELLDTTDKQRLIAADYNRASGKEAIHFAFPFAVPGGQMRLDLPIGSARPDADLIPGSCRNWLTAGRFADIANADFGVTWATLDAPLVEVGGITATLLNSQTDPKAWRQRIAPSQLLFSWAMNNHWHTNYRAFQQGPVTFRYALRPHLVQDLAAACRFAIGLSQPLIVDLAGAAAPAEAPLLELSTPDVIALCLKPADDHRGLIVRLYGASGRDADVGLSWRGTAPRVWLSDSSELPRALVSGQVHVPAWGVVTLRAETGR